MIISHFCQNAEAKPEMPGVMAKPEDNSTLPVKRAQSLVLGKGGDSSHAQTHEATPTRSLVPSLSALGTTFHHAPWVTAPCNRSRGSMCSTWHISLETLEGGIYPAILQDAPAALL